MVFCPACQPCPSHIQVQCLSCLSKNVTKQGKNVSQNDICIETEGSSGSKAGMVAERVAKVVGVVG